MQLTQQQNPKLQQLDIFSSRMFSLTLIAFNFFINQLLY